MGWFASARRFGAGEGGGEDGGADLGTAAKVRQHLGHIPRRATRQLPQIVVGHGRDFGDQLVV